MRSRLSLCLNDLTLDEILHLEEELDRRKEKYRRNYAVLSVQADRVVLQAEHAPDLGLFAREMRRYISASAAAGGGTLLAYSPEVSVLLFNSVQGSSRTCGALLSGLPEFNGRFGLQTMRIGVKLGLASGVDILAAGSLRCVRASGLVRRANQAAWRSAANSLLMDENSYQEWPDKFSAVPAPFDIDGQHIYRLIPGSLGMNNSKWDNEPILRFLKRVTDAGILTLKYDMERVPDSTPGEEALQLVIEGYDAQHDINLVLTERIVAAEFADRMDVVKRMLSSTGLALVRHELIANSGV
ncbi:MAG TPA: hypothetical protein VGL38_12520 [bacterium]|jgi:hypothetical protein